MRLSLKALPIGFLCGALACSGAKPKKAAPDYEAIQARAASAHKSLGREGGAETASSSALAPEVIPKTAKVLETDSSGCTWVESQAVVVVGDIDSKTQVRAAAVAQARDSAMRDFLGVEVRSHSLVFQQEDLRHNDSLVENVLRTIRHGHILKEEMVAEGYQDMQGCPACRYGVDLKTCLTPLPDSHDKAFRVDLQLLRDRLVDGDEAQLSVSCTKDCWVYLYNVGLDWETAILAPNASLPEVKLKAGDVFKYPDEDLKRQGVHLVAQLPPGKSASAETIRVVASEAPLSQDLRDPSNGGYLNLIRRLIASGTDWAEDTVAFTIYQH